MQFNLIVLLSIIASIFAVDLPSPKYPESFEEASTVIKAYVESQPKRSGSAGQCDNNNCCTMSSTESCSITNFPKDQTTLVLPGGSTRCINSYSTPFAFQVVPGDSDKLLFYFQGGGACWDEVSTKLGFCTSDAMPQSLVGIFDRTNLRNVYRAHTIVHVLYCSGDVHAGNSTRPYTDRQGGEVSQVGLLNSQATVDWVKSQIAAGNLASTFSQLTVMGASAGSLGAQLWAEQVLKQLNWKQAAVLPDSYAGVFAPGSLGPIIYDYGFCESGFLSPALYTKCINKQLDLIDMGLEFQANTPTVPWGYLQSKTDVVQLAFYIALAATTRSEPVLITPNDFYNGVNSIFGTYNAVSKNFITYLVDGDHHVFSNQDLYYHADTMGPRDSGKSTDTEMLYNWVNHFPLRENQSVNTRCDGTLQGSKERADNTYCSNNVSPKNYVEHY